MLSIQKIFHLTFIVFLISANILTSFSQQKPIVGSRKISEDEKQKQKFIIEQAILSLKDILLNPKTINDIGQRAYVVSEASTTLWKYDKTFAQDSLLTTTNNFISDYDSLVNSLNKSDNDAIKKRKLNYAIKILLRALAKNDLKSAEKLQKKFLKLKEDEVSGEDDLDDKLKVAEEGDEVDIQQSVNLIAKIIEFGIPTKFPQYLFDLKKKNPELANRLYQQALFNLSAKAIYQSKDAILISSYAFNESGFLLPFFQENKLDNFFIISNPLNLPSENADKSLIAAYFSAYQSFLSSRLQTQAIGSFNTPNNLLQLYFLTKKLKAYDRLFNLGNQSYWENSENSLIPLAQNAGISPQLLNDAAGYAERLASNNNPLGLSDGTDLFDKAEKSNDPREKMQFLIEGIIRLIETEKFAEAEGKIFDVSVKEIQDALLLLVNTRASIVSIKVRNRGEFEKRINKISDRQIKAFLYVKALDAIVKTKKDKHSYTDYLLQAEKNLDSIDNKVSKTSGLFTLSALVLNNDITKGRLLLSDALKALNNTIDFNKNAFEINIRIPGRSTYFADFLGENAFENVFMKIAKIDWLDSQVQATQIKSQGLKAIAQIATAKAVLQ